MKNRFEEYLYFEGNIPFVINSNLRRTQFFNSMEANWHEDIEIQFCDCGVGEVLVNGEFFTLDENSIIVVNSGFVHYTATQSKLEYNSLIISAEFCKNAGIDTEKIRFQAYIEDSELRSKLFKIRDIYKKENDYLKAARLQAITLEILVELCEKHQTANDTASAISTKENIKEAINYIKAHHSEKISLDTLARAVYMNKYVMSRAFKNVFGMTVFEYINSYRCNAAAILIARGHNVNIAARECGFDNMSFFAKTFKTYMGVLPSEYKKRYR